jgi:hydrophobic/amphiphilic exporter-1 (mainly G- bacteria), HAE1 family
VNDPGDLENVFVQAGDGQMIPLSSFVRLEERAVAPELEREGQNRSVEISAGLTPALSLGDALAEVQALATRCSRRRTASCRWPRRRRSTRRRPGSS